MTVEARQIVVHGRVQGVGFRFFVRETGMRLGLTGNVCNREEGRVEIIVEGRPDHIAEFIREVEKGPPASRVVRIDVRVVPPTGSCTSFLIEGW